MDHMLIYGLHVSQLSPISCINPLTPPSPFHITHNQYVCKNPVLKPVVSGDRTSCLAPLPIFVIPIIHIDYGSFCIPSGNLT